MAAMKWMRETWILAVISLIDMIITLWLIHANIAVEANPVMQTALSWGTPWFVLLKCLCTFGPLLLLERVSRGHRELVRRYMRLGIGLYLTCHIGSLLMAVGARLLS